MFASGSVLVPERRHSTLRCVGKCLGDNVHVWSPWNGTGNKMATRPASRYRAVRRQIEFILDTSRGEVREIIIKTGPNSPDEDRFNRSLAEALQRRSLAVSPRDVLPDPVGSAREPRVASRGRRARSPRPTSTDLS